MTSEEYFQQQLEHQRFDERMTEIKTLIRYHKTHIDCLETEMKVMRLGIGKRRFYDDQPVGSDQPFPF